MSVDARKERFELVEVFDRPMLFTCLRVDRNTVPKGLYLYEVRNDDDQCGIPVEIGRWIMVNHWGTLLSATPIKLEPNRYNKAIIEACTHMNGAETVSIGSYRGFSMLLSYDGAANEFRMVLKGKLSHTAVLGADAGGNVTRIDNALEKITEHLANARSQLAHTTEQLENARTEMTAPFPKEAELAEKTRRLNELNVLLNLNEQDRPVMADEPDEGDRIRPKNAERER